MKTAALLLALAGCGGGSQPPAAPACTPAAHITVQLFGDSTMSGDEPGTPGYVLRGLLEQRYPGKTSVIVSAVSGTTSQQLAQQGPIVGDILINNMGINDARYGVPVAQYAATLSAWAPGKTVIWDTPLAIAATFRPSFSTDAYVAQMRSVAAARGDVLVDVNAYELSLSSWENLTADGIHPTAQLYQLIVQNELLPAVASEVDRRLCER